MSEEKTEKRETIKVTVSIPCVKYGTEYYVNGQVIEIFKDDQELIDRGFFTPVAAASAGAGPETEKSEPAPPPEDDFTEISGIGDETALTLKNAGLKTFEDLADAKPEALAELHGVTIKKAEKFIAAANAMFEE